MRPNPPIIENARSRPLSVGLSDREIHKIAATREIARNPSISAVQDGVVIGFEAADGMYLQPNTRAVSLTGLATVWLVVDVFERNIDRLTEDMTAAIRSHEGSRLHGFASITTIPNQEPRRARCPVDRSSTMPSGTCCC